MTTIAALALSLALQAAAPPVMASTTRTPQFATPPSRLVPRPAPVPRVSRSAGKKELTPLPASGMIISMEL